jgi:hypothetical protein
MMMIENYKRDLDWVLSVLESCETLTQVEVSENCYDQLMDKWGKSIPVDKFILISEFFEGEISFKKKLFIKNTFYTLFMLLNDIILCKKYIYIIY